MQPNAPSPAPPPISLPPAPPSSGGQSSYDFILNHNAQTPKKFSPIGGNSLKQRAIIAIIGGGVLLIIALVVISFISNAGKSSSQSLIDLARQQQELIRVAEIGVSGSRSTNTKNLAATAQLSLQTTQNDTIALLKKQGYKLSVKDLALKENSQTDQQLDAANLNNSFDDTFTKLIRTQLANYRSSLNGAYKASKSKTERQILQTSYNGVTLLIGDQTAQSN